MTINSTWTRALGLVALAAICGTAGLAHAEYPERKIQHIYPWSPGTPTYAVSQIIADKMGDILGTQMPVVATPGAGGVKAFQTALDAPADGYTTLDGYVAPLIISPLFDQAEWGCADFVPLYSATSNAFAIISRADEDRWTDFPSFIEYLKANPGETRYSGGPDLSLPHMVAAKVMQNFETVSRPVPYNDLADGLKDLRGGVLDWMVTNPGMYRSNKEHMRVLMILSELEDVRQIYDGGKRAEDYGIDMGLTGLAPMGWNWWLVQEGTPEDRVAILRKAMGEALADETVRKKIIDIGFVPTNYTPDQYLEVCESARDQLESAVDAITWEKEAVANVE